jgi:hypothetical protein
MNSGASVIKLFSALYNLEKSVLKAQLWKEIIAKSNILYEAGARTSGAGLD